MLSESKPISQNQITMIIGPHRLNVVEINGVLTPLSSVTSSLAKKVAPLTFYNDDPWQPLQIFGSIFLVKVKRRYLGILTAHQLKNSGRTADEICIFGHKAQQNLAITTSAMSEFKREGEQEDIVIVEFASESPIDKSRFIDCTNLLSIDVSNTANVAAIFAIGCPMKAHDYEIYEKNAINFKSLTLFLKLSPEQRIRDHYQYDVTGSYDKVEEHLDGFSGGPVFYTYNAQDDIKLGFAGLVTMAKNGRVNAYSPIVLGGYITAFLKRFE